MFMALAVLSMICQEPTTSMISQIQRSHIEANVPPPADFDRLFRRDLEAYFDRSLGKKSQVQWEMLRDGPTQTGVAYPKCCLGSSQRERRGR